MLLILIISHIFSYKLFYNTVGVVKEIDGKYYITFFIERDNVKLLAKNKYIVVDDTNYLYQIYSLNSELYIDNNRNYQEVFIICEIPITYKINNLVVNLKIIEQKKKLITYLKEIF